MRLLVIFFVLNGFITIIKAQEVIVALEPFPPFVDENAQGLSIDMLREIEKYSDLSFKVLIMTYARAKHELKHHRIDIAGHTPKNLETEAFYKYAAELEWQIQTTSDLFSFDPAHLEISNIKPKRIGTTTGNAVFLAEQLGVDSSLFVEVRTLEQLVDIFIKGRIDVLLFERASVMTLLNEKSVYGVHYKSVGIIPASMAVHGGEKGRNLKIKMDNVIKTLDLDSIFSGYLHYIHLPTDGITSKMIDEYKH